MDVGEVRDVGGERDSVEETPAEELVDFGGEPSAAVGRSTIIASSSSSSSCWSDGAKTTWGEVVGRGGR